MSSKKRMEDKKVAISFTAPYYRLMWLSEAADREYNGVTSKFLNAIIDHYVNYYGIDERNFKD